MLDIVEVKDVVPWLCWAEDCPSRIYPGQLKRLMLAKHWHILRSFPLIPQSPSTQEMPAWLVKPSIGNQADVANAKMKKSMELKEARKAAAKRKQEEQKGPEVGRREGKRTKG